MSQSVPARARQRINTEPLPALVEVPNQCTYRGGCPNEPMIGNRDGQCELHATYGETPPPELDDDGPMVLYNADLFTCA